MQVTLAMGCLIPSGDKGWPVEEEEEANDEAEKQKSNKRKREKRNK